MYRNKGHTPYRRQKILYSDIGNITFDFNNFIGQLYKIN